MNQLAVYGAITATVAILLSGASLAWQVYSWRRERVTDIKVEVSLGFLTFGPQVEQAVFITASNRSEHAIRINSAGLGSQDGSGNWAIQPMAPNGATIPGTVQPHDSAQTWWLWEAFEAAGFDPHKPVVGRVVAGNGEKFRSKPRPLFKR